MLVNVGVQMGREKKDKQPAKLPNPPKKMTKVENQAYMVEMVAKAPKEAAAGRARPF